MGKGFGAPGVAWLFAAVGDGAPDIAALAVFDIEGLLACPKPRDALQELMYYERDLSSAISFSSARKSSTGDQNPVHKHERIMLSVKGRDQHFLPVPILLSRTVSENLSVNC